MEQNGGYLVFWTSGKPNFKNFGISLFSIQAPTEQKLSVIQMSFVLQLRPSDDQTIWNSVRLAVVAGLRDACKRAVKAAIFNFSEAVSRCLVT